MVMKAIDKSRSPLWVRILVWILVGGLMAASAVGIVAMAIMGLDGWEQAGQDPQPIILTPEDLDLSPEVLEELMERQQMAEQEAGTQQEDLPAPDADESDE